MKYKYTRESRNWLTLIRNYLFLYRLLKKWCFSFPSSLLACCCSPPSQQRSRNRESQIGTECRTGEGTAKCTKDTSSCRETNASSEFKRLVVVAAACRRQNLSAIELDLLQVARAVHPSSLLSKKKQCHAEGSRRLFATQWPKNAPVDRA